LRNISPERGFPQLVQSLCVLMELSLRSVNSSSHQNLKKFLLHC